MRYWILFDFGFRGNPEQLYIWLDNMKAQECGGNMATFKTNKKLETIVSEVEKVTDKNARIYMLSMFNRRFGGRFIVGQRRRAPWTGYGSPDYTAKEDT